jgi:hypothetical protein
MSKNIYIEKNFANLILVGADGSMKLVKPESGPAEHENSELDLWEININSTPEWFLKEVDGNPVYDMWRLSLWGDTSNQWAWDTFGEGFVISALHSDEWSPHIHMVITEKTYKNGPTEEESTFQGKRSQSGYNLDYTHRMELLGLIIDENAEQFEDTYFSVSSRELYYQAMVQAERCPEMRSLKGLYQSLDDDAEIWPELERDLKEAKKENKQIKDVFRKHFDKLFEMHQEKIYKKITDISRLELELTGLERIKKALKPKGEIKPMTPLEYLTRYEYGKAYRRKISDRPQEIRWTVRLPLGGYFSSINDDDEFGWLDRINQTTGRGVIELRNHLVGREKDDVASAVIELTEQMEKEDFERIPEVEWDQPQIEEDGFGLEGNTPSFAERSGIPWPLFERLTKEGKIYRDRRGGLVFPVQDGDFSWDPHAGFMSDFGTGPWELEALEEGPRPICMVTGHPLEAMVLKSLFDKTRILAIPNNPVVNIKEILGKSRVILVKWEESNVENRSWEYFEGQRLVLPIIVSYDEFGPLAENLNQSRKYRDHAKRQRRIFKILTGLNPRNLQLELLWKFLEKQKKLIAKVKPRNCYFPEPKKWKDVKKNFKVF